MHLPFNTKNQDFLTYKYQFAGVSREDFLSSDLTIAASLFNNVFGQSAAAKALPALVAISAIGHLLSVAFTVCTY